MITSDWEDWLALDVADASPEGVSIWYLGCNGFILKASDGTTIFIDPYLGTGSPPRTIRMIPVPFDPGDIQECDGILVSHGHTDHIHGPSQAPILAATGSSLYGSQAALQVAFRDEDWLEHWSVTDDQLVGVAEGDEFELGSFTIAVGPAHDPDADEPLSYVIQHDAGTVFHGGDTKPSASFAQVGNEFDIDVAIVAIGSVGNIYDRDHQERSRTRWYCDENEAVEIANLLEADRLLPSHWDMWKGVGADPTALYKHATSWPYPRHLEIVEIGDRIDL